MAKVSAAALTQLLSMLHAPSTPQNLRYLEAWQQAEGGNAAFNPFNTTQPSQGAGNYNSVGVKNYRNLNQGLQATINTLENGKYTNLVNMLRGGKATAMQLAQAEAQTPWGTGALIQKVLGGPVSVPSPTKTKSVAPPVASSPTPTNAGSNGLTTLLTYLMGNLSSYANSGRVQNSTTPLLLSQLLTSSTGSPSPAPTSVTPTVTSPTQTPDVTIPTAWQSPKGASQMIIGGKSPYKNIVFTSNVDWQHVNPKLLNAIEKAAYKKGVKVTVNSGYRSNKYSQKVGGFANDPHTKGLAVDAYVNGKPIGDVIPPSVWQSLGVRSGNVANFYNGQPDPEHLDII